MSSRGGQLPSRAATGRRPRQLRDAPSDFQTQIHNESYFGQATVDLYEQLYLTGALRDDGSSTFGQSTKRALFPKASAAWTFTKYYQPSFLTLRGSCPFLNVSLPAAPPRFEDSILKRPARE